MSMNVCVYVLCIRKMCRRVKNEKLHCIHEHAPPMLCIECTICVRETLKAWLLECHKEKYEEAIFKYFPYSTYNGNSQKVSMERYKVWCENGCIWGDAQEPRVKFK